MIADKWSIAGSTETTQREIAGMMPVEVIDSSTASRCPGLTARKERPGPEQELVNWFLGDDRFRPRDGNFLTVFREPRLDFGVPDIVFVEWSGRAIEGWPIERSELQVSDLKLVHFLSTRKSSSFAELESLFTSDLYARLERLVKGGLIQQTRVSVRIRPLSKIFAVRRLIAIEAKIKEWSSVISQARMNTWFAFESYVLVPHVPSVSWFQTTADQLGIGIWAQERGHVAAAQRSSYLSPKSYASWMFNEWAWRASL